MIQYPAALQKHLAKLSAAYSFSVRKDGSLVIIRDFLLPPGYNWERIAVVLGIPSRYPVTPLGDAVFVPNGLRFHGKRLDHMHPHLKTCPVPGDWAWYCLTMTAWDCFKDDFITFLEFMRADLTNPALR